MTNPLYDRYVAEIHQYSTFKDGWGEEYSQAPKSEDIASALKILSLWPKELPLICPMIGYEGTIGFYTDPGNYYLDIEIEENDCISVYLRSRISENEKFFEEIKINDNLTEYFRDKINNLENKE